MMQPKIARSTKGSGRATPSEQIHDVLWTCEWSFVARFDSSADYHICCLYRSRNFAVLVALMTHMTNIAGHFQADVPKTPPSVCLIS